MHKVFIADYSKDFSLVLAGALRSFCQVETCADGAKALAQLRVSCPDVLILDLMLPGLPGMDVLRAVKEEGLCSAVIITSSFLSEFVLERLQRFSVDYVLRKPCTVQAVLDRVEELCARIHPGDIRQPDPPCAASSILLALNMSTHMKGFRYSRQAILMLAEDPSLQVTKSIYPAIAKQYSTTKTAVEKAIRSAIDAAWATRNNSLWQQYFTPASNGQIPKPTNAKFLARLADTIAAGARSAAGW